MVVQKGDGTQEVLEPADFEKKYGFKNDPAKVHLLKPLPPSLYPLPGMPMGSHALVREPAELADGNVTSWTIETHSARDGVVAVAYRPDGKLVATAGADGTIRLWDPATGGLVRMLVGAPVASLSWSADGKVLAAACLREGTWLWGVDAGRVQRRFHDPERWASTLSPEGRRLAVQAGGTLELWNAVTGRTVSQHGFPESSDVPPVWSPDGKVVAVCIGKVVRLWDVASAKVVRALEGHEGKVLKVAWSPDGKRLVSVAWRERAFRVWDAGTGKLQGRFALECTTVMPAVAWSPDGKLVALGSHQGSHGLFDPETGRLIRTFNAGETVNALAWSPDGKQVVLAGSLGSRLYEVASGKRTHTLDAITPIHSTSSLAWSPDARWLALGFHFPRPDCLRVEAATGRRQVSLPGDGWLFAAWSPDAKTFATAEPAGVRLWDVATNRPVRTLDGATGLGSVAVLAWSADGKTLVGGSDGRLWVWSAGSGKVLWQNDKQQYVSSVDWSPDGRRLASVDVGEKRAVRIWEADTGKLLHEIQLRAYRIAWSPVDKTLVASVATPSGAAEYLVIDAASGAVRVKTRGTFWDPWVRWAPDGKTFTTLSARDELRVWDSATGERRRAVQLSQLPGSWASVAWSPDGRVLARCNGHAIDLSDSDGWPLGVLLPGDPFQQLAIAAAGHYRGTARVERAIRVVVQKRDGTSETLTPAEFARKYGFKNDPEKVRLTDGLSAK